MAIFTEGQSAYALAKIYPCWQNRILTNVDNIEALEEGDLNVIFLPQGVCFLVFSENPIHMFSTNTGSN